MVVLVVVVLVVVFVVVVVVVVEVEVVVGSCWELAQPPNQNPNNQAPNPKLTTITNIQNILFIIYISRWSWRSRP